MGASGIMEGSASVAGLASTRPAVRPNEAPLPGLGAFGFACLLVFGVKSGLILGDIIPIVAMAAVNMRMIIRQRATSWTFCKLFSETLALVA
jgi:hypothetical protein